jgi:hypothetical protein
VELSVCNRNWIVPRKRLALETPRWGFLTGSAPNPFHGVRPPRSHSFRTLFGRIFILSIRWAGVAVCRAELKRT